MTGPSTPLSPRSNRSRGRFLAVAVPPLLGLALAVCFAAAAVRKPAGKPAAVSTATVRANDPASWPEIDRLVSEQKYEQAATFATIIRERARASGDDEEWARALIQEVQLRTALHGYETSVRFLRDQPWPKSTIPHAALELFYARSLVIYVQGYGWEIGQREKVESKGPVDLKAWTRDQINAEAVDAFERVWRVREELGRERVARLSMYLTPNNYPERIRGTLRDALSYLFTELLADSSLWRPEEENDLYRIELAALLEDAETVIERAPASDGAAHPLERACLVLSDLEAWHQRRGDDEAAFEARLERFRRLHAAFTSKSDRKKIREALESSLPPMRTHEWWAVGQNLLAEFVQAEGDPDCLVRARRIAQEGERAFPGSIGAERCRALVASIEAPGYQIQAATSDGNRRKSIQVTHKNVAVLHFRAYAVDLVRAIETSRDYNLLPGWREIPEILKSRTPDATWSVDLPPTADFRDHRTFVTPPMKESGLWVVIASARADFTEKENRLVAVDIVLGDLALVLRSHAGGVEVSVLSGRTGEPVTGAEVSLVKLDWQKGHQRAESRKTDAHGLVRLPYDVTRKDRQYAVFARKGKDIGADAQPLFFSPEVHAAESTGSLVYTDRSVYRPLQTISWKVVAYRGGGESARFTTLPGASLTVSLMDANNQMVDSKTLASNGFGSAAGTFVVPSGRLLGRWRLVSSLGGEAALTVEEYKRPTFEVTLKDPTSPLRVNRPARLTGGVAYYFGLPVVNGEARWRVRRESVFPWWWWNSWGWRGAPMGPPQVVATGRSPLREDGTFEIAFTPDADEREAVNEVTYQYAISVDVTDEGGETRSASRSFRLGFVSIEATITTATTFFRTGEAGEVTIRRTSLDGTVKAGEGRWRLFALAQPKSALLPADQPIEAPREGEGSAGFETPGDRQRPRWNHGYSPETVLRQWPDGPERAGGGTVTHDERGEAHVALGSLPPGAYRLRYETVDEFGAVCRTQKEFIVAARKGTPLALPFVLQIERSSVRVGETARLFVQSALPDQRMVLELWRDGRRTSRREIVAGLEPELIEIPVGENHRGGFGVTLTALRDHQLMSSTEAVHVPWDDKELEVEFATFRDRLRPGSKETWRVSVKGPRKERIDEGAAEVLAYMYDRSLDVFAPHQPASVAGLYPWRAGAGWVRGSMYPGGEVWSADGCFSCTPGAPQLIGDQLRFYEGYPIGGMGGRFRDSFVEDLPVLKSRHAAKEGDARRDVGAKREPAPMAPASATLDAIGNVQANEEKQKSDRVTATTASSSEVQLRSDFSETAFWAPQLLTGSDGSVVLEFTVPDSVTSWNVWAHAVTRDLRGGSVRKDAKSIKELMVRPYLPRFLREGDEAQISVVVNDAGERPMRGSVELDVLDPLTQKSLAREFGLTSTTRPFAVKPGGGTTVSFPVRAPSRVGLVAFRVTARSGDTSDGELRPVPLLPGRMHLAQSRFAALKNADRRELRFADLAKNDDPSRVNEQLVVTLDTQLFYGVLDSLPYLVNYPYECTEQTLNRFLSTGIVSSLYDRYPSVARMAKDLSKRETRLETWDGADANRKMGLEETPWLEEAKGGADPGAPLVNVLDPRIAEADRKAALAKLVKAQTSVGGFPWWSGGPPSPWMTLYILNGFSRALEFGVEVPKDVTVRAWAYMHRHYLDEWVREAMARDCCWESVTFLNYVLSNYPDDSWTGGVFTGAERAQMLEFSFRHWREHSPLLKGYLTLTLERMGRHSDARLVFDSVMDSAKTTEDEGTFWAAEDRSWLWYNDTIESHAFALRVLMEMDPKDARRDGLVQWLFLNKKLNHWKSTRATAEVIYSLVHYLQAEDALGLREEIAVNLGGQRTEFVFEPDRYTGKKTQIVLPGPKIDPATAATVTVEKRTRGLAFASATWMFSTERLPEKDQGDFFRISRIFFRREQKDGEWVLTPLAEGARIAVGDQVEVKISLRSKHEAEYVHLRDPRAAGFEPESAVSRWKWDLGIAWYEETRDSGTNFFFEKLPVGEYTFRYRLRAATAGTFKVSPATVQSMYAPEFNAYSAGKIIAIGSAATARATASGSR